ncbi:MAG: type 1 glutamine amidotransferase [Acidobacteria bacterium]|nr:type 1 glutamine amidotransferase [Acidobacteriota bacterium]
MKQRVGITTWPRDVPVGTIDEPNDTVPRAYIRSVIKAGGLPVLLPVVDPSDAVELLASVDAVVIAGGGDVDPALYGQETQPETDGIDTDRDAFDVALWQAVLEHGTPALAICRGAQILNVALGGSLIQHIDGHRSVTHHITFDDGREAEVNSLHHQALDRPGAGVTVTAWSDDGTIEAIEVRQATHITAVQWHPELLRHQPDQLGLFERLTRP